MKKATRDLEKEIRKLEMDERRLEPKIKAAAKKGQMAAARIQAKDLVRTRRYITNCTRMKAQLGAISMRIATVRSTEQLTSVMGGATSVIAAMNSGMNIHQVQQQMRQFMRENEKMEMKQEMMDDAMEDAFAEGDEEGEMDKIVDGVLTELGIETETKLGEVGVTPVATSTAIADDGDLLKEVDALLGGK
ncbi:Snf7 family like protein [Aduncisulcus paluster]|uniref:Snf7 family like protein n=1 Tax=Aduncisulcus paluster TaxID=2918883 RepID=A0ABQ5JSM2_9EUKA|nr:Snf7 family like protein [Aduncisulcus paluster]